MCELRRIQTVFICTKIDLSYSSIWWNEHNFYFHEISLFKKNNLVCNWTFVRLLGIKMVPLWIKTRERDEICFVDVSDLMKFLTDAVYCILIKHSYIVIFNIFLFLRFSLVLFSQNYPFRDSLHIRFSNSETYNMLTFAVVDCYIWISQSRWIQQWASK